MTRQHLPPAAAHTCLDEDGELVEQSFDEAVQHVYEGNTWNW